RFVGAWSAASQLLLDELPFSVTMDEIDPFLAGRDGADFAVSQEIDHPVIVHGVQLAVEHGRFPRADARAGRDLKRQQADSGSGRLVQGRYDQLRLAGAENVTPAHAVGPALAADCVDGP